MDESVIWDDEPGGNVEHVAEHGLTPDEVDERIAGRLHSNRAQRHNESAVQIRLHLHRKVHRRGLG
jgi:hypothetical protein